MIADAILLNMKHLADVANSGRQGVRRMQALTILQRWRWQVEGWSLLAGHLVRSASVCQCPCHVFWAASRGIWGRSTVGGQCG
jgi:hypothetical protein